MYRNYYCIGWGREGGDNVYYIGWGGGRCIIYTCKLGWGRVGDENGNDIGGLVGDGWDDIYFVGWGREWGREVRNRVGQ